MKKQKNPEDPPIEKSPEMTREQTGTRVSRNTIWGNIVLSAFKLFAGITAHSAAMVSDGAESIADVVSTCIVIAGFKLANRRSDKDHPYGHERLECVAAILLATILFAVGLSIGWDGVQKILAGSNGELAAPGLLALIAAIVTIVVKEAMYWYTRATAKKIDSSALMANAWHHRSDAFSSIGTFSGILGARLGLPILDPIACVITCGFIFKAAVDIFRDSVGKMTDTACDDTMVAELRTVISAQESVLGIDQLKTRRFGDKIYVDVEISADGDASLRNTHRTAQQVHDAIERRFPKVKHCMVHVNPFGMQHGDE